MSEKMTDYRELVLRYADQPGIARLLFNQIYKAAGILPRATQLDVLLALTGATCSALQRIDDAEGAQVPEDVDGSARAIVDALERLKDSPTITRILLHAQFLHLSRVSVCLAGEPGTPDNKPEAPTVEVSPLEATRELVRRLYDGQDKCTLGTGAVGGHLHIVLDDGNVEAAHVQWCLDQSEGCATCYNLASRLLAHTEEERQSIYENHCER